MIISETKQRNKPSKLIRSYKNQSQIDRRVINSICPALGDLTSLVFSGLNPIDMFQKLQNIRYHVQEMPKDGPKIRGILNKILHKKRTVSFLEGFMSCSPLVNAIAEKAVNHG